MMSRAWVMSPGLAAMLLLSGVVGALAGCDTMSFRGGDRVAAVSAEDWPFVPESMRVHPFTKLGYEAVPNSGGEGTSRQRVLEARLELLDPQGHVTKGVGDWRFELYEEPRPGSGRARQRLEYWQASMGDLDANRRHYDAITRTYVFKLRMLDPPPAEAELTLVAQLTDPLGNRIIAEGPVDYEADAE